jgi:hypothetical protein
MRIKACAAGDSPGFTGRDEALGEVLTAFELVFEPALGARNAAARVGRVPLTAAPRADFAGFLPDDRALLTFFTTLALFLALRAGVLLDGRAVLADCVLMIGNIAVNLA